MTPDNETTDRLTIEAHARPGSPATLRAEVHVSTDLSAGAEYTLKLSDPGEVLQAVRAWLGQVLGATATDPKPPGLPIVIHQEVVYAVWRYAERGDRALYPESEWWAVRMEHTALEQPEGGRMTGALRLTQTGVDQLLADPHGLARVPYESPDPLLDEIRIGRRFSSMTGWTRVS
jgi:hypothetical protein